MDPQLPGKTLQQIIGTAKSLIGLMVVLLALLPGRLLAHGSVSAEDDRCLINIEFMQAHFTVFQPEARGSDEFCENIPEVTRSVFVMEYLHTLLNEMEIDFRIIRDVNNLGRYADWEDVEAMEDIEEVTVFYQRPRIEEGGFYRASHDFQERGTYIGIVTADHPTEDRQYNAVFYFRVGGRPLGTWPLFIALALILQGAYWASNGGYRRWQEKRQQRQENSLRV
jgi:hypothetical protein